MQKIAIVTPTFPPYRGGIGKVAELDATQLAKLGHAVTVFTPKRRGTETDRGPASFDVVEMAPTLRYGNAAFVPYVTEVFHRFDVVVAHVPFFGALEPLALAADRRRSKLIVSYHMDVVGGGALVRLFSLPAQALMPGFLRSADRVLVTSFDYARSCGIAPLVASDPSLFRELAPSIDPARFAPGPRSPTLLDRYGLEKDDRIILFLGGLDRPHYFKGLPVLLRALATKDLSAARLLVVGEGELRPRYESLAKDFGVRGKVVFAGSVPEDELADHHRLADVFAFPSVDRSEAFGVAALEALACGVPVVASDLPGVRTIVRDGETGFTTLPGSVSALGARLRDLLDDSDRRTLFSRAAREMAAAEYPDDSRMKKWRRIIGELKHQPSGVSHKL